MRSFHLLRKVGQQHDLDLAAISQSPSDAAHIDEARDFCRNVAVFQPNTFVPESATAWTSLLSTQPRSFAAQFSKELQDTTRAWVREEKYDALIAVTLGAAPYALGLDIPFKILDQHNVESQVLKRRWENERTMAGRIRFAPTWLKAQRYERNLAKEFNLITVVSKSDMFLMRRLVPHENIGLEVIPNGVDDQLLKYPRGSKYPNVVLFSGAVTYRPNYDAVSWLCSRIMPRVREAVPSARLVVTGDIGEVDVSDLRKDFVEFTGYVDDIRPVVGQASVLATPLTGGGGTRLKILEAMAMGTPVVSTTMGAEGLSLEHGVDALIGDTTEEISRLIVKVLNDNELSGRIARSAEKTVAERFLWSKITADFERAIVANSKRRLRC